MAERGAQERTEEATAKRRLDARRKGTVARSSDLNAALVMFALLILFPVAGTRLFEGFTESMREGFQNLVADPSPGAMTRSIWLVLQPSLGGLTLIAGTAMVVGLASNFSQVGFVFSGQALEPKLDRLNPLNGIRRMFSWTATFEGVKAVAKSVVFMLIAYLAISASWAQIFGLSWIQPDAAIVSISMVVRTVTARIAIAWLALAAVDYFFQRKQVAKQLMMSKDELKQEMRETEQSPELKGAIAQRRRRLKRRMMQAVKSADAVITNPTHYAVAVKYEPGKQHAPQVVAKGADLLAARIREEAQKHHVPIVPNPPLARALYRVCEVGDYVPREHFQGVAEVLAYVYKTLKRVRQK